MAHFLLFFITLLHMPSPVSPPPPRNIKSCGLCANSLRKYRQTPYSSDSLSHQLWSLGPTSLGDDCRSFCSDTSVLSIYDCCSCSITIVFGSLFPFLLNRTKSNKSNVLPQNDYSLTICSQVIAL